jgi:hypothetical protein
MPRYAPPRCQNRDPDETPCAVTMKPLGERHPSFGPNYRRGGWVFQCPRCEAIRFIGDDVVHRYVERIS